jgi:hypothetical protein
MAFLLGLAGLVGFGFMLKQAIPDTPPAIVTKPGELIDDAKDFLSKNVTNRPPSCDSYYKTKEAMKNKYHVK